MSLTSLQEFLDRHGVPYETISHAHAETAQEIAAAAHVSGKQLAKTVIVKLDGELAMVVLPGCCHIDFKRLQQATGASQVALASEAEFQGRFPDCEVGAMPPFGNLYGLPVLVAAPLAEMPEIVFNAGTHTELMRLAYRDFARLVQPRVLDFTAH
jgi:Ala-tRNA(Pro) deacylase